jgi:DeoR family transcriptional regulator of aga operon/DeoR family fructose operon transcriptional repressor
MNSFGVSIETVRRDLAFLEERGYCERVYGGAVRKKFMNVEPKYLNREKENSAEKHKIAIEAEKLISNGDTVFFDLGTTVQILANNLDSNKEIISFTNALRTAITLSDKGKKVFIPGGELRGGEYSLSGSISEDCMNDFNIDKAFIGVGGITENGISDFIISEARLRSKIIKNARKVIALADFSKFGVCAMCKVCDIECIDVLITDDKAPVNILRELEKNGIQIIIAK